MSLVRNKTMEAFKNKDKESQFWKISTKPVPGRPRVRKEKRNTCPFKLSPNASFYFFQESVSDAWEIGEEEFCSVSDKRMAKKIGNFSPFTDFDNNYCKSFYQQLSIENFSDQLPDGKYQSPRLCKREESVMVHRSPRSDAYRSCSKVKMVDGETAVSKVAKFEVLLETALLDLEELQKVSWSGVPMEVRPMTWRLLAGYLPVSQERRKATLDRKRHDYWNLVRQYFKTGIDISFQDTYRQIQIDVPRMSPLIALFKQTIVQEMFERILYIWAIRHPASGYVQGINDLVTPFYIVFLQEFLSTDCNLDDFDVKSLPKEHQDIIEADSYWCLSKFLDGIQDNYVFAQLGIQLRINQLKVLIKRIDADLHKHLQRHGVDYLQFSFRWMNNLLTREIPLHCSIRLWDTYLAESNGFGSFHIYVCAAILLHWRRELLQERDFQGILVLLQNLPTHNWNEADISVLVAEAYRLRFTFADGLNHLQSLS